MNIMYSMALLAENNNINNCTALRWQAYQLIEDEDGTKKDPRDLDEWVVKITQTGMEMANLAELDTEDDYDVYYVPDDFGAPQSELCRRNIA